ncbi:MAG: energy transducer TonB [Chlorobi bacterium]|nr:energy transducer TonB [Chlorobiota bacterium]
MSVQEALKLGAYDLKRYANRNLAIAFLIALLLHVVLLGYPMIANIFDKEEAQAENLINTGPITLEDFKEEDLQSQEDTPPDEVIPPPPMADNMVIGTGSENAMARIKAVQDLEDGLDIESFQNMNIATPQGGGDGGAPPLDPSLIQMPTEINYRKEETKISRQQEYVEFISEGTIPQFDMGEIESHLVYPEVAEEAGIEGTVYVQVFINEHGKITKILVKKSDNSLFNNSAMEAIRKTTFTPAIQNGYPIRFKMIIPVRFRLVD